MKEFLVFDANFLITLHPVPLPEAVFLRDRNPRERVICRLVPVDGEGDTLGGGEYLKALRMVTG